MKILKTLSFIFLILLIPYLSESVSLGRTTILEGVIYLTISLLIPIVAGFLENKSKNDTSKKNSHS